MVKLKNLLIQLKREGLKQKLVEICEENEIVFMALFGSFVSGDYKRNSDIDILINFEESSEKTLFDMVDIRDELQKIFKRRVDLLTLDSLSKYIKDDIINSMRVIYEKR